MMRRLHRGHYWAGSLAGIILLAGCQNDVNSTGPAVSPVTADRMLIAPSAVVSTQSETLSPTDIAQVMGDEGNDAYLIGPDDVVSVYVLMHPELSIPIPNASGNVGGTLITADGYITIPMAGPIKIGGMSVIDAQNKIANALSPFIHNPQVAVQIVDAQSMRYYLLGSFINPGVKYPVHQLRLLDALALGGSVDMVHADLYQAYVAHNNVKLPIDLAALLTEGDMSQNIPLAPGDAIVIPTADHENAFVFGAIAKPGIVPFQSGSLSLPQALGAAGFDLSNYTDARLSRVRIIRPRGRDAEFFVVDAAAILRGEAAPFALQPGDIVFVPPNLIATWNQAIGELLPSLQTVGAVLNPFVSIKYLDHH
jgi:polysaccharide export outer membrane protein